MWFGGKGLVGGWGSEGLLLYKSKCAKVAIPWGRVLHVNTCYRIGAVTLEIRLTARLWDGTLDLLPVHVCVCVFVCVCVGRRGFRVLYFRFWVLSFCWV